MNPPSRDPSGERLTVWELVANLLNALRQDWVLAAALVLPALPYTGLWLAMPSQFRVAIALALADGFALAWEAAILLGYLILVWAMIRARGRFSRIAVLAAAAPLAASTAAHLGAVGPRLPLVVFAAALALGVASVAYRAPRLRDVRLPSRLNSPWLPLAVGALMFLGAAAASLAEPIKFPRALGSLAILALFTGVLSPMLAAMALVPRFAVVAIAYGAVALLFFEPNNHAVPLKRAAAAVLDLDSAFVTWLSSRRDLDAYRSRGRPYPVIFVSSEGGGIYAAAHAYGTLSAIARSCPTFSQHVFAVVGVSGGAIGNVLYAGATPREQSAYAPCAPRVRGLDATPVVTDHLSPVLARLLMLESLDRLLPGQWLEVDRGQVLTDSFLSVAADPQYARATLADSYDPTSGRPAVLAVTTDRSTGNRMILSPFMPENRFSAAEWWPGTSPYDEGPPRDDQLQIGLMDAAGLSARFPWITPTGLLRLSDDETRVLADGGYFDNSGAETITDLLDALRFNQNWADFWRKVDEEQGAPSAPAEDCSEPRVVLVNNFHFPSAKWENCQIPIFIVYLALASDPTERKKEVIRQSFLGDPLAVLLSSRGSRGENALDYADLYYCGLRRGSAGSECSAVPGSSSGMFRNDVAPAEWDLPLGWHMPLARFDAIVKGTAADVFFDFRRTGRPADTETELMIYHLDPALWNEDADPAIGSLYENFAP